MNWYDDLKHPFASILSNLLCIYPRYQHMLPLITVVSDENFYGLYYDLTPMKIRGTHKFDRF